MKIKGLSIIAIACICLVISFNVFDIFINNSIRVIHIIETISLSYIAAYIFYFLNVYLIEKKEYKNILPYIGRNVFGLVSNNRSMIYCLAGSYTIGNTFYPTDEEFRNLLKKTNPKDKIAFYYKENDFIYLLKKGEDIP